MVTPDAMNDKKKQLQNYIAIFCFKVDTNKKCK